MDFTKSFKANLENINEGSFENEALQLFNFQYKNNKIYQSFVDHLGIRPTKVDSIYNIPFLPIEFFKTQEIKTGEWESEDIFESSGTTGTVRSKHHVKDVNFYLQNAELIFQQFYGPLQNYCFLALLPSYLERDSSSLVFMANHFIRESRNSESGFYLSDFSKLIETLKKLKLNNTPTIIIGVTFALLDLAEQFEVDLSGMIFMETGGMKGRRQELTQVEVHEIIKNKFSVEKIHTEYGMTEILSQAYSFENGILQTPNWMKILIRDINDPFDLRSARRTGGVNIIDLANVDTCAFIETKDIGEVVKEDKFKILGRFDNSEIRGCNLLIH